MKYLVCLFIIFFQFSQGLSQSDKCSFNSYLSPQQKREIDLNLKYAINGSSSQRLQEKIIVPVVVHILYNNDNQYFSYDQILKQIEVLNKDFCRKNDDTINTPSPFRPLSGKLDIEFKLARRDPSGNPTLGITWTKTATTSFTSDAPAIKSSSDGGIDAWNTAHYLNIWVCNITDVIGSTNGISPGSPYDGITITTKAFGTYGPSLDRKFNKGRTLTHEVGHWLGLMHIWGPNRDCGDDQVADTPPQNGNTSDNLNCPPFPFKPSTDANCNNGPYGRMFNNYMDYSRDACMNMFTRGQADRMSATFFAIRNEMLNSLALNPVVEYDLALEQIITDTTHYCYRAGKAYTLGFKVRNIGLKKIKGFSILTKINERVKTYHWDNSLNPESDTTVFIFDAEDLDLDSNYITATISTEIPIKDQFSGNDSILYSYQCNAPVFFYPNPATDWLYVKGNIPKIRKARFFSLEGKELNAATTEKEIYVSNLPPGYYTLLLETDGNTIRHKVIIIH